ncbi:MAG TPA: alpha/beta hydrolase [Candidatus Acidoferrum sp.]|nr:alpha/beta hydrolase [Candidatus Acidoferrum sp.]
MSIGPKNANFSIKASAMPRRAKTPAERVMPPVVYRLPGMDAVTVHSNLKYSDVNNPYLLMDVYTPPGLSTGDLRPIVVFIHGGVGAQYKPKDWGLFQSWGRLIAAGGMVAVMFTHRLGYPKPLLAESALDVANALDYIRSRADSFHADPGRIGLVAWSGGAPLLSTAMRERPSFVRCMVAFYGYLDVQRSPSHMENETPESLEAFSPISHLHGDASSMIPLFVARAGQDEVPMMNDSIDRFLTAAIAANSPLTYMNHPFGEHGFDNQNEGDRSREIVRNALAFLQTHLGAAIETQVHRP